MGLRNVLDRLEPQFRSGGRHARWQPLFDAVDTFFYSPATVTQGSVHVRDGIDARRVMVMVWLCALPAALFGILNVGRQALTRQAQLGIAPDADWRQWFIALASDYNPASLWDCFWYGLWFFLPLYAVCLLAAVGCEALFALTRRRALAEGTLVSALLFALICPPAIPLWMAALGVAVGVVVGQELLGRGGRHFLNPVLLGYALLLLVFPATFSGEGGGAVVDGRTGATALALAQHDGLLILKEQLSWIDALSGARAGAIGETATLAVVVGGAVLLWTGIAAWRIVAGALLGLVAASSLCNWIGPAAGPLLAMPWYWHLVTGGFLFGALFLATDPRSAATTNAGRWWYGALIGALAVLLRVGGPTAPEATAIAILLGNLLAPLIDRVVVAAHIKRRLARR